jgi:hypothetical protein
VRHDQDGQCETIAGFTQIISKMGGMILAAKKKEPLDGGRCCTVRDASSMGYQIEMKTDKCHMKFRIGDMIAVRDADHPDVWSLSVVRWARYTRDKNIRVGMFIMGKHAERYRLQTGRSPDDAVDVMSVTGTSNFPVDKKVLLAPMGIYRPGEIMTLIGADSKRIVAGNLIMSGADFDVFDFKPMGQ